LRQGYGDEAKVDDEFWKTEDYFEKLVLRTYQEQHAFMFEHREVEGKVDEQVEDSYSSAAWLGSCCG
jgi:hypothetical protein